jgi:hypothetical protein
MLLPLLAIVWTAFAVTPEGSLSTCTFQPAAPRWTGSCGRIFDERPRLRLARANAIASGIWRADAQPAEVWSGDMTDDVMTNPPIELEIYPGGTGVLRTEYGWFPVSGYTSSAASLTFQVDASREVAPSELDRRVVQSADAILASASAWNRADNRRCPAAASSWSIYCAMERAEIEVTGGFHHRRPAMETVRRIIEERTAGRRYHHRLMDYNNDRTTSLGDVHAVFAEALARIDRAAR